MPNLHAGIPYHKVRSGSEPGCYQLHRPDKCRHKFPPTQRPLHKCEGPNIQYATVPEVTGFRKMVIPRPGKNLYPVVMQKKEYERLQQQAKKVTQEEIIAELEAAEIAAKKAIRESEARKQNLKEKLLPQPGADTGVSKADAELNGPDQSAYTLSRAEILKAEHMVGPRLANQIILASKCHAIRDAQCVEKVLIKKELEEEERRLDEIMEQNRLAAIRRAEAEEQRRHDLRLQNLAALQEQINARESAKIMDAERIEEESIRMNQANIAMQIDEAQKMKEKHERQHKLKQMLDQGNQEILYYKQLQNEEDRITDLRIQNFMKQKQEREAKVKADQDAIKEAKKKDCDYVANAQKAEQELKEELERIHNLKIMEDVEREYRRKERDAAIKRNKDIRDLHIARTNQIKDIHRNIAREIAKDELTFNNAARQNEEYLRKQKVLEDKKKAAVEKHRQEIMKQIDDKEKNRVLLRETLCNQGVALRMEIDLAEKLEREVIKQKIATLRQQKVAEKYVKEVEQTLAKHGYFSQT